MVVPRQFQLRGNVLLGWRRRTKDGRHESYADEKPTDPDGVPLLGNSLAFSRDPFGAIREWAKKGDVVRLNFPGQSLWMVTEPEFIEYVLMQNGKVLFAGVLREHVSSQYVVVGIVLTVIGRTWAWRIQLTEPNNGIDTRPIKAISYSYFSLDRPYSPSEYQKLSRSAASDD